MFPVRIPHGHLSQMLLEPPSPQRHPFQNILLEGKPGSQPSGNSLSPRKHKLEDRYTTQSMFHTLSSAVRLSPRCSQWKSNYLTLPFPVSLLYSATGTCRGHPNKLNEDINFKNEKLSYVYLPLIHHTSTLKPTYVRHNARSSGRNDERNVPSCFLELT